jgi:hypothetical protein
MQGRTEKDEEERWMQGRTKERRRGRMDAGKNRGKTERKDGCREEQMKDGEEVWMKNYRDFKRSDWRRNG